MLFFSNKILSLGKLTKDTFFLIVETYSFDKTLSIQNNEDKKIKNKKTGSSLRFTLNKCINRKNIFLKLDSIS